MTVIDAEHDLVSSFLWNRTAHEDFVFSEVGRIEAHDGFHVETAAGFVASAVFGCVCGVEDEAELFGELKGE